MFSLRKLLCVRISVSGDDVHMKMMIITMLANDNVLCFKRTSVETDAFDFRFETRSSNINSAKHRPL